MATVITGTAAIQAARMCAQWHALKLEGLGMKRRGESMRAGLARVYGLPARCSLARVQEAHKAAMLVHCEIHALPVPGWAQ